jgi:hypothetical protein
MQSFKLIFSLVLATFCLTAMHVSVPNQANTLAWNKTIHDFGDINDSIAVSTDFICWNIGDTSCVIENIMPSCGCIVPNWSRNPIQVGDSSLIHVEFNPKGKKKQHVKTIAVYTNQGLYELFIKANIKK